MKKYKNYIGRQGTSWLFGNPYSLRFLDDPSADPPPAVSLVNADGTFIKDWTTKLTDETLHNDATLTTIPDINTWAKNHVNLRKQVPMDKMPRPTEHFTDTDWDEFHKAGGWPDTAGDFNIKRHESLPESLRTKEVIEADQEFYHKNRFNKKQVDALEKYNEDKLLALIQNKDQQEEMDFTARKDGLTKKWGIAFDQKVHLGDAAIEKGAKGDLDFKERLIEKINKDPDLIEFTSNLGSLFAEHKIDIDPNIPTPADMDTRIREAQNHPAYMDKRNPDHNRQVQLVQHLIQEKTKHLEKR